MPRVVEMRVGQVLLTQGPHLVGLAVSPQRPQRRSVGPRVESKALPSSPRVLVGPRRG
jgi:hypothetical protein